MQGSFCEITTTLECSSSQDAEGTGERHVIYSEKIADARKIAETVLSEMETARVPVTPPNYMVWFDHVSGRNPALSRIIEQVRTKNISLTRERNREIYEKYCALDIGGAQQIPADQIESIAGQIAGALNDVGKSTKKFGVALAHASGSLDDAPSGADIAAIIKNILSETQTMDHHVHELQAQVQESQTEITALRKNLEASKQAAMTDGLTGLTNRRSFDDRLTELVATASANSTPLSLVISDVDHFKKFNDVHGHQMGDQVLRLVGHTLKDCTKGRDVAARYGGEEFALILPETDIRGARSLAENLRKTLASRKLAKKGSTETLSAVTMSFGVTEYIIGETIETFIARADAYMYQAKYEGRNRVRAGAHMPEIRKAS
jgi:diguanylate cyclase